MTDPALNDAVQRAFTITSLLILCALMACGPKSLLQGVAWSSMLISYSLEDGLEQGFADTFSGERPCDMCRFISADDQQPDNAASPANPIRIVVHHDATMQGQALPRCPAKRIVFQLSPTIPQLTRSWVTGPAEPVPIA